MAYHDRAEAKLAEPNQTAEEIAALQAVLLTSSMAEAMRQQAHENLSLAVKKLRQGIVISERVVGLDSSETMQQYEDLGLLEHACGDPEMGLRLTKHALLLRTMSYGPRHPAMVHLLVSIHVLALSRH